MATKIRILYDNEADNTNAVVSDAPITDFPLENLWHPFRTKTVRIPSITNAAITWDLTNATAVDSVFLINHNFDVGGTYKFQGNATDSWGSPTVDETITFNSGIMVKYFTSSSQRFWRLDMTNSSGSFVELGRMFFGSFFEPTINYNVDWRDSVIDPSILNNSLGGQTHADVRTQYRQFNLPFRQVDNTDKYDNFLDLITNMSINESFVMSLDVDNFLNDLTFYTRLINPLPGFQHIISGKHDFVLNFKEEV